jgi:riboflavin-specific deaminase-like protein
MMSPPTPTQVIFSPGNYSNGEKFGILVALYIIFLISSHSQMTLVFKANMMLLATQFFFILLLSRNIFVLWLKADAWTITPFHSRIPRNRKRTRSITFANHPDANQNECFSTPLVHGITLKIAVDSRGAAADLGAKVQERFTCDASLDMVHRLRASTQAVLVGKGTVQADNPSLLVRRNVTVAQQPLRVVLDPSLSLFSRSSPSTPSYQLFHDGYKTVVFHTIDATTIKAQLSEAVQFRRVPTTEDGSISLTAVLHILSDEFKIHHLMVEGGPYTAQQFLRQKLIDRCIRVQAPIQFTDQPLDAGMTEELLQDTAGLVYLGSACLGVDSVSCWSRPRLPWPGLHLEDWP